MLGKKYVSSLLSALCLFVAAAGAAQSALAADSGTKSVGGERPQAVTNIATFDSGFGGFFTAKEIEKRMVDMSRNGYGPFSIAHYGDTTNLPYGEKTPEQIAQFASEGILAAFRDGAQDVYIACNTASTQFGKIKEIVGVVRPEYSNHVHSIIDISVKESMKTVSRKLKTQDVVNIAVMATPATIKSENYPRFFAKALSVEFKPGEFRKITQPRWLKSKGDTIDSFAYVTELKLGPAKKVVIYQMAPANWVDMIENGASDEEKASAVKNDIATLTAQYAAGAVFDVVGEFCTHYPVFDAMIRSEMKALGKSADDTPFVVQGPLMANLFQQQYLQKRPSVAKTPVAPPATPPIYLSGTNIEATANLVKKIFPNDPQPTIERKAFVLAD